MHSKVKIRDRIVYWTFTLSAALALHSCAQDQTKKKRASNGQQGNFNQQGQPDPNGQFNGQNNGQFNQNNQNNNQNNQANPYTPLGGTDVCGAKNFSKGFSSSLTKTVLLFTVNGDGVLNVTNNNTGLELDVNINNINVTPFDLGGSAQAEIQKVIGKRQFFKFDQAGVDGLKNQGGPWESTHCKMGVAKTYKFPYAGATITVEFSPGLPFAPYPDKADSSFDSAVQAGLNFTGITGRIVGIEGNAPNGFSEGFEASGSVQVTKEGSGYKVSYNFGSFANLEKMGLFDHTIYEFNGDDVQTVKVQVPILDNADKVNLTFQ